MTIQEKSKAWRLLHLLTRELPHGSSMSSSGFDEAKTFLEAIGYRIPELIDCPDCHAKPGEIHLAGCDVERCSVCGEQYIACGCDGHDPAFARWTGIWPGGAESDYLGIDMNEFHERGLARVLFVKPKWDQTT